MTEPRSGRADDSDNSDAAGGSAVDATADTHRVNWSRVLVYGLLPGLALLLAMAAGFLKWKDSSIRNADIARSQSIVAATDSAVALLSFRSETIETEVEAARARLTGDFRETYAQVTREVLIPNAKERHVSATASVPAVASVSATANHAVVLLFVDQTVRIDGSPPSDASVSVRVTLDKIGDRWLVSGFDQF
jgi:Mce-associated membrane protein